MRTSLTTTLILFGFATAGSTQVLDTSETRVQTTLDPGLNRIGTLVPRKVGEISAQNWSLGCETLDRAGLLRGAKRGVRFRRHAPALPDPPCEVRCGAEVAYFAYRKKPTGQPLLTLWTAGDVPSDDNTTVKATVTLRAARFQDPVWVDLITGGIYEIPPAMLATHGDAVILQDIPLYDAPIVIADQALMMK